MKMTKETVRSYIKSYDERHYLDVKTILAELAVETDSPEMMKLSVLIGLIQTEVNDLNSEDESSSTVSA